MSKIQRRTMLKAMAVGVTGTAVTALGATAAQAFTPPVRGLRYQKFGGHNFEPNSTLKGDQKTDRTYNDNGSIYVTGSPGIFNTRLQLPDGAVIEEVQFNYFLGSTPSMLFQLFAFDNAGGFQLPYLQAEGVPGPGIQTISLGGLPVRVNNAAWNYVLRWVPQAADPAHMLWGARVGYRPAEDTQ